MDTLSASPTPDTDTRIAALEHQLAELTAEFRAARFSMEMAFEAGRASITNPTRPQELRLRPRHLHVVSGGER